MTSNCNPIFTDKLETIGEIRLRTGHDHETVCRAVRAAMAARLVTCKLIEDEYAKIPAFQRKAVQP